MTNKNIQWHQALVSRSEREARNGHRSVILWFTGLSGAGKSTLAHAVERRLYEQDCSTFVFDGDNVRHGLCSDLGFSPQDREENIRRVGEMAKLFIEAGVIAITASSRRSVPIASGCALWWHRGILSRCIAVARWKSASSAM